MKLTAFFLGILFLGQELNAQAIDNYPWCPAGATWIYYRPSQSEPIYDIFRYYDDEIIDNRQTKKISLSDVRVTIHHITGEKFRGEIFRGFINILNSNDSIFIYHENAFRFLYSFAAVTGDQFIVNNSQNYRTCMSIVNQDDTIFVDNRSIVNYSGIGFETIHLPFPDSSTYWSLGTKIFKNIGASGGFWPGSLAEPMCAWEVSPAELSCYSDDLRGDITFSNFINEDFPCSYLADIPKKEKVDNLGFSVFPNPSSDLLHISNSSGLPFYYQLFDMQGRKLFIGSEISENTIDISKFKSGTYFLKISKDNTFTTLKFNKL